MSWSISTTGLRRISNFDEARLAWERAVPWTNESPSWRQLDGRRMVHKRLVKLDNEHGFQCVLHDTPVVTYFADGNVKLNVYDSVSTLAFSWYVKPEGCAPTSAHGRMFWRVGTVDGDMYYRPEREALLLTPAGEKNWLLTNEPAKFTERKYNPKLGAAVRKELKTYRLWHDLTKKLGVPRHTVDHQHKSPYILELVSKQDFSDSEKFGFVLATIGDPDYIRDCLYLQTGAHHRVPAPYDRLPRILS